MMKNYDGSVEINHNPMWHYISDHTYRFLVIGGSVSGKTYVLLKLIKHQKPDINKISSYMNLFIYKYIYMLFIDPFESKY